ncbi:MAG: amidohydrolase [Bacteroidetes bacterium]|nr:amidohydrolase [Bacteroidota bacterium]
MKHLITLLFIALMAACQSPKETVDLIVHHATVYTVDDAFSTHQAFAVKDGKFVAVGTNEAILGNFESDQVINADGKFIYPGFNDAHCHFYGFGTNLIKRADLVGTQSFEEVVDRLKDHYASYPSQWLEGRGWDQNDWEVKEFPSKDILDKAFPDTPVFLIRIDGHAAVVNSKALELAKINAETRVQGGEVKIASGEPTGVLIDNAMDLVSEIIPEPDEKFNREALLRAQDKCFAVGLTSVSDAGLSRPIVELIDSMQQKGELNMRIYAMLTPNAENLEHFVKKGPYQTDFLNVRSIKLYADGALGSRGARMIEPYSDDPGNYGLFMQPETYYDSLCRIALKYGYQVNTHAIGDGGNRFVLGVYAKYLQGKNDLCWRIEHAQIVHPDDFQLFGKFNVIPSVQPTHATSDMYWADERVGPERIKGAYAYKQLLDENGWIPLGTDFPIESINPMYTFYAAVARKDLEGWPEEGFQMENVLSREEALRGMTIWAAKAALEENQKGSIESGKVADFVMMDFDLMNAELSQVPHARIVGTFVNGRAVFQD